MVDSDKILNIGPKSRQWLKAIGVYHLQDVKVMGPISIYFILKQNGYPVTRNLVYALEAALRNCDWRQLPADVKQELNQKIQDFNPSAVYKK